MPPQRNTEPIHLSALPLFIGSYSWDPNVLQKEIRRSKKNYCPQDPSTWPRITSEHIFQSEKKRYDGSKPLPGGMVAFDDNIMQLFSRDRHPVKDLFLDYPFYYDEHGHKRSNSQLSCSQLETYIKRRNTISSPPSAPPPHNLPSDLPPRVPRIDTTGSEWYSERNNGFQELKSQLLQSSLDGDRRSSQSSATPTEKESQVLSNEDKEYAKRKRELKKKAQKRKQECLKNVKKQAFHVVDTVEMFNTKEEELKRATKRADTAEASLEKTRNQLGEVEKQLDVVILDKNILQANYDTEKNALDTENASQKRDLEIQKTMIKGLEQDMSDMQERLADQQAEAAKEITEAKSQITQLGSRNETLEATIRELQAEKSDIKKQLDDAKEEVIQAYEETVTFAGQVRICASPDWPYANGSGRKRNASQSSPTNKTPTKKTRSSFA